MITAADRLNVLCVETYPAGSHGRILDLWERFSTHQIESIRLERGHWRWLGIAAHYEVLERLTGYGSGPGPDLLLFSGPLDVASLLSMLPAHLRDLPRVAYFHESQWTYPLVDADPRPYLVQHLDTMTVCDESWFNSRFHRDTFWESATSSSIDRRIRALARRLQEQHAPRNRVVYPPIAVTPRASLPRSRSKPPGLLWNARWEYDKQPDRFIELLDRLAESGQRPPITILGTAGKDRREIVSALGSHADRAAVPGHLPSRRAYEDAIPPEALVVATGEHEFFGVAMLEATLLGCFPVLPAALAYPETIPSAYFYQPGDVADLSRIVTSLLKQPPETAHAHTLDAARFVAERTVPLFDAAVSHVVNRARSRRR